MFWTIMNALKNAIIDLGEMIFSIFIEVGAVETIIAFTVVAMFISFVVLGRRGVFAGGSSDKVKKRSEK